MVGDRKTECPNCAVDVPKGSRRCPVCGYEFPRSKPGLFKWIAIVLLIIFLIPLLRMLIGLLK